MLESAEGADTPNVRYHHASSFVSPVALRPVNASSFCARGTVLHLRRPRALPVFTPSSHTAHPFAILSQSQTTQSQAASTSSPPILHHQSENASAQSSDSSSASAYDMQSPADESLALLEWPSITARVLRYASTELGCAQLRSSDNTEHLHIGVTRHESEELLAQTREANVLEGRGGIDVQGAVDAVPLSDLASKGRVLTGEEIFQIGRTLRIARETRRLVLNVGAETLPVFHSMAESLGTAADAEREIMRCVDDTGELNENAVPELAGVRQQMRETTSDARATLQQVMGQNADAIQERIITSRYDRFVIPVKTAFKNTGAFRSGVVHDASASGSTSYVEPTPVRPLNDRLRKLAARERAIVLKELTRLSQTVVAPIADELRHVCVFIGVLDAAAARAKAGQSLHAADVRFQNDDGEEGDRSLYLPSVRHPLLMWAAVDAYNTSRTQQLASNQKDRKEISLAQSKPPWWDVVVPSTYTLAPSVRCVCVTGPNTGGKTLTLKTLGVLVLMAKAGLFIPACATPAATDLENDAAADSDLSMQNRFRPRQGTRITIPYFDSVLADIGDDQSLVQSLSTFSGHVRRIKRILAASTEHSLVLLDEIGSGTDPAEGAALGMAVLKHLAVGKDRRAKLTFATTHHGELKTLKYSSEGMSDTEEGGSVFENASVEFDDVAMRPTYKLIWGIPGRSNALAIAQRLGLDKDVIKGARELLTSSRTASANGRGGSMASVDIERMIQSLEHDKRAAEQAKDDIQGELHDVMAKRIEVEQRLEKLKTSEVELRKQQRLTIDKEVENAQKQIKQLIREMQQGGGSAQAATRAAQRLRKLQTTIQPSGGYADESQKGDDLELDDPDFETNVTLESSDDVQPGDRVMVKGLSDGEVEVVDRAGRNDVIVALGAMKTKVKMKNISAIRRQRSKGGNGNGNGNGMLLQVENAKNENKTGKEKPGKTAIVRTGANSIDVRGQRVDGAIAKIETAMDRALPLGALWIIHGHGTGRLKTGIRKFLAESDFVERFVDAEQSQGGTGVTIVFF